MPIQHTGTGQNETPIYAIKIRGHLTPQRADWFEGMEITLLDDGVTLLTGHVIDQAALHRLLRTIRDLGMPLLAVMRTDALPHPDTPSHPDPFSDCSTQGDRQ